MKKKDDGKLAQDVSMAETLDTLGAKINELSASVDQAIRGRRQTHRGWLHGSRRAVRGAAEPTRSSLTHDVEKTMTGRFDRLERKLDQVLALLPVPRRRKSP